MRFGIGCLLIAFCREKALKDKRVALLARLASVKAWFVGRRLHLLS